MPAGILTSSTGGRSCTLSTIPLQRGSSYDACVPLRRAHRVNACRSGSSRGRSQHRWYTLCDTTTPPVTRRAPALCAQPQASQTRFTTYPLVPPLSAHQSRVRTCCPIDLTAFLSLPLFHNHRLGARTGSPTSPKTNSHHPPLPCAALQPCSPRSASSGRHPIPPAALATALVRLCDTTTSRLTRRALPAIAPNPTSSTGSTPYHGPLHTAPTPTSIPHRHPMRSMRCAPHVSPPAFAYLSSHPALLAPPAANRSCSRSHDKHREHLPHHSLRICLRDRPRRGASITTSRFPASSPTTPAAETRRSKRWGG
ncbi:hypothetical protein B0H13DRAFT_2679697 [Mycena leptocephala]|nr:hypothetical protein B0H13DRAFT_2679697 [Mycena leptocephala]